MKRKRYIKLLMSIGYSRNEAQEMAKGINSQTTIKQAADSFFKFCETVYGIEEKTT